MPTKDEVLADLAVFSDLGTSPIVEEDVVAHLRVGWTHQGITRSAQFQGFPYQTTVSVDEEQEMSYAAFLASPLVADLARLAKKITLFRSVLRERSARELRTGERVFPMSWYVDPRLGSSPGASGSDELAMDFLSGFTDGAAVDATRLLFVMAEAGQGKSSVLEEFTVRQAERYLKSDTQHLALYIDAQGRGLARLDEVIARQLNDLQFLLGYNGLVALVREGLVTLVIDGFDELIGSRGTFDDAFRSLSAFLEVLNGRGSLIAAGRSTYFVQEYESRGRLLSDDLSYSFEQAFLKSWTQHDQDRFVDAALETTRLSSKRQIEVRESFQQFHDDSQLTDLLSRPLFARDVLYILLDGGSKPADLTSDRLIPYLAQEYLVRETEDKLRTGDESFLQPSQLEEYYRELAEEMWQLETRELDVSDAEAIIDAYAEDSWGLSGQAREIARARAGKLPFLAVGDTSRRVKFEHEVFFGYFLASSIVPALTGSGPAPAILGRGQLDPLTADLVAQMTPSDRPQEMFDALRTLSTSRHPRRQQIELNSGALGAALLRRLGSDSPITGLAIRSLSMVGEDLAGVHLSDCTLEHVHLDRVDLRASVWQSCAAIGTRMEAVLIDPTTTILELEGFDPSTGLYGLQFEDDQGLLDLTYDPAKIQELLVAVRLAKADAAAPRFEVSAEVMERMEEISRAFRHANPIGTNHTRWGSLFTDKLGEKVVRILLDAGILEIDPPRPTKGPSQTFYRKRFVESELMGALFSTGDRSTEKAWTALAAL